MLQHEDTEYYYFKETEITDIREIQLQEKMLECELMKLELFSYKESMKLLEEKFSSLEKSCEFHQNSSEFWELRVTYWKRSSDFWEECYNFSKKRS